jgi:uroporphyrinogen decarboxylase
MSPFSLPIMQMGFEKYLQLIYFHKEEFARLMRTNIEFCVSWANAQLRAGATAICYFDPLASPNNIERNTYLTTGYEVARETLSRINGPIATHLASGITLPVIDDIIQTGASVLGFSCKDDLGELKKAAKNRICLLGNLNALDMMNWSTARLEDEVKQIISKAGKGGGLILADNHGDVPWQVPEDVLLTLSEAVRHWGQYPLKWVEEYENA